MAAITSFLGLGSGLDLKSLLDQLDSAERLKLEPLTERKKANETKISAFGTLQGNLSALQTASDKLNDIQTFQGQKSATSGTGITVAASSEAVAGSYQVKVTQLARAQSLATSGVADVDSELGSGVLSISAGSVALDDITVDSSNNTLSGIRDAINAQGKGVMATIINDGDATAPYRLVISSRATGEASPVNVSFTGIGDAVNLLGYDSADPAAAGNVMTETVPAANAKLTVNGLNIVSQSNTVEEAIQGVTITATSVSDEQTVTISRDTAAIRKAVTDFVGAYNTLITTTTELTSYNADTKVAGALLGDSSLRNIQAQIRTALGTSVEGGAYSVLSDLGVSLQVDGKLKIDDSQLDAVLNDDINELSKVLAGSNNITKSDGIAGGLSSRLATILSSDGIVNRAIGGLKSANSALDEDYTRLEASIVSTVDRYRTQFAQLDALVADMNSTASYLTQQFNALTA